jgi:cysteine-rich repeat protein
VGSYSCTCPVGFESRDGACADIDECLPRPCGVGTCFQTTPANYACDCPTGYRAPAENGTCADIDECAEGTAGCDANATCANTVGAFTCTCNAGYAGSGATCADVDECALGATDCSPLAECTNTVGSYTCACREGYEGSGVTCVDRDECADGTGRCDTNELCVNQIGAPHTCECRPGTARPSGGGGCVSACGNGVRGRGEECDDGNVLTGDGCDDACQVERGWSCYEPGGAASVCEETCGDGLVDPRAGEECDDGPDNSDTAPDGCRTDCERAHCGDGVLDTGERCDDGAMNSDERPGACRTTCVPAFCGDGVVDEGESCDPGGGAPIGAPGACVTVCPEDMGPTGDAGGDPDAGLPPPPVVDEGGCGCRVPGMAHGSAAAGREGGAALLALGALLLLSRRGRARARRRSPR